MRQKLFLILMLTAAAIIIAAVSVSSFFRSPKEYRYITLNSSQNKDVSGLLIQSDANEFNAELSDTQSGGSTSVKQKSHEISYGKQDAPKDFDISLHTKRMYELAYLFGIKGFDSPQKINVDVLVQYAFCHLYYDSLVDMPKTTGMIYRQAVESSIHEEIHRLFNITNTAVKTSILYNESKNIFEMWQPDYSKTVYADVSYKKLSSNNHELTAVFYEDSKKKSQTDTVIGEFKKNAENYSLIKMTVK